MKLPAIFVVPWLLLLAAVVGSQGPASSVIGRFFRGDGLGEMFSLEIKGDRFSYVMDTDVGTLEQTEGAVEIVDGRLWFSPASGRRLESNSRLFGWWVPVQWAERLYLVGEGDMLEFVNHVNDGSEPRKSITGSYLLRREDADHPAPGLPSVPPEWRDYLLRQPVNGLITKITDSRHGEINLGRRHGLRSGMVLWVANRRGWLTAPVTIVGPDSSQLTAETGEEPLSVGQRVTSRP